jgi:signal transduction histidine kinase
LAFVRSFLLFVCLNETEIDFILYPGLANFARSVCRIFSRPLLAPLCRLFVPTRRRLTSSSSASAELRTPLNSTTGMLELIRTVSSPEALGLITSFLDVADVSLDNLKDILEDCLEYSKLSNHNSRSSVPGQSGSSTLPNPQLVESTLEQLVLNVMVSCTFKSQKLAAVKKQDSGEDVRIAGVGEEVLEEVGLFFESTLPPDLVVMVDVGGLKRILLNLIGNAIKVRLDFFLSCYVEIEQLLPSAVHRRRYHHRPTLRSTFLHSPTDVPPRSRGRRVRYERRIRQRGTLHSL